MGDNNELDETKDNINKNINKLEFIKKVIDLLRTDIDEKKLRLILKDYSIIFNKGLKEGKTEKEIVNLLGTPEEFVKKLADNNFENIDKLGTENYNIFNELIEIKKIQSDISDISDISDDSVKDSIDDIDDSTKEDKEDKEDKKDKKDKKNKKDKEDKIKNNSQSDILDNITRDIIKDITEDIQKNIIINSKPPSLVARFLLGLALLIFFIPIIICGFIGGITCIMMSIGCSIAISIIHSFWNYYSIMFVMIVGLCLLTFGVGTICLNLLLSINYVKYFFLINNNNLEDTQDA